MTFYEIQCEQFEASARQIWRGATFEDVYNQALDHFPNLVARYFTESDARAAWERGGFAVPEEARYMPHANPYYLGNVYYLQKYETDDDGDIIGGGDWLVSTFPVIDEPNEEEEEDEE